MGPLVTLQGGSAACSVCYTLLNSLRLALLLKRSPFVIVPTWASVHTVIRFHFQDLGRQCIILAGILEDLGRKCSILQEESESWKILQEMSEYWKILQGISESWKKVPDLARSCKKVSESCKIL